MDRRRCARYGEIVGVYEPAGLLLPDGNDQHGSALTLGDALEAPGAAVVHDRCYEAFEQGRAEAGG